MRTVNQLELATDADPHIVRIAGVSALLGCRPQYKSAIRGRLLSTPHGSEFSLLPATSCRVTTATGGPVID
jgi:hypothetical protein